MTSRPLPPGNGVRSPVRQNVALRWLDNVASAPAVSKPSHSPVKRWPPPKVAGSVRGPVVAVPTSKETSGSVVEKQTPVSVFQSARAVFEAKKLSGAASPPPPPTRRQLAFPDPPATPIVKQHSAASDLSASSCSTVDSESDRKLKETVEAKHEPKFSSQKSVKMESAMASPSSQAHNKVLPCKTKTIPPPLARESQSRLPPEAAVIVTAPEQIQPNHVEIDPFRLLLPVEAVPNLPDEVICVYDSAAVDMEKNIKKVVRKLLKKNKTKLEEFKVNSRLYGIDFMDAHAYLDTLINDFGAIRALQLVPCLLSIQPNMVKSNGLLLTAKNYLLRHEAELERELQSLQVSNQKDVTKAPIMVPTATAKVAAKVSLAEPAAITPPVIAPETAPKIKAAIPTVASASKSSGSPVTVDQTPSPFAVLKKQPTKSYATNKVMRPVEPMPEPQEVTPSGVPPPLINVAVSTSQIPGTIPTAKELAPIPVVTKRAESDTPSDSEEEFRAENLFGEAIKPSPLQQQSQQRNSTLSVPVPPTSPASSTRSFEEAKRLFGERVSSSSHLSVSQRKTVTWGETKTVEACAEKASPVKTVKKPAPLLFGLATAAAFDSDSDESDFSD